MDDMQQFVFKNSSVGRTEKKNVKWAQYSGLALAAQDTVVILMHENTHHQPNPFTELDTDL